MRVLFENRWQATKARWLTWGLIACMVGCLYWAWSLAHTYGLLPADGGVLRPLHQRLMMAAVVVLVGVLPTAGMWLFNRRYLTRIERDGDKVALTTLGIISPGTRIFRVSDFTGQGHRHGQMSGRIAVNAPWIALRVAGVRLPFVVDLQAEHVDIDAIEGLSSSAPAAAKAGRQERRRVKMQNRA